MMADVITLTRGVRCKFQCTYIARRILRQLLSSFLLKDFFKVYVSLKGCVYRKKVSTLEIAVLPMKSLGIANLRKPKMRLSIKHIVDK